MAAHNFWKAGCCAVFDVRVTDTDAPSQRGMDPMSCLARHEKDKKKRYLQHCTDRHRSFTPLVFSVDGLFSSECLAAVRRLSFLLAEKWNRKYSVVCGYVRARLQIALVRASGRCLRAERSPIWRAHQPRWENGDGLYQATMRKQANFLIQTYDAENRRRSIGGDQFFVAVRGSSRCNVQNRSWQRER